MSHRFIPHERRIHIGWTGPDEMIDQGGAAYEGAVWPAPEYAANMTSEMGNLGLTPEEEGAIVAFLKTLTDTKSP